MLLHLCLFLEWQDYTKVIILTLRILFYWEITIKTAGREKHFPRKTQTNVPHFEFIVIGTIGWLLPCCSYSSEWSRLPFLWEIMEGELCRSDFFFLFGCLISRQAWSRCRVSSYVVEKSTCPFSFILKIVWNFKMRKQKGGWKKETNEREGKTKQQQKEKGKRMKETRETKEKNI